jgi:hypothetical protein
MSASLPSIPTHPFSIRRGAAGSPVFLLSPLLLSPNGIPIINPACPFMRPSCYNVITLYACVYEIFYLGCIQKTIFMLITEGPRYLVSSSLSHQQKRCSQKTEDFFLLVVEAHMLCSNGILWDDFTAEPPSSIL